MTPSDVSSIIRTKHLKTKCELYTLTETQIKEGKTNFYDFIITKGSKKISHLITKTLELQNAPSDLHRLPKSRIDILQECLKTECVGGCNNEWYQSEKETYGENNVIVETFSSSAW